MLAILAVALITAYVGAGLLAVKTLTEAPAFERKSSRFDLRLDYGTHTHLFKAKPAVVTVAEQVPEELEAVNFEVMTEIREPVPLGYKVVSM